MLVMLPMMYFMGKIDFENPWILNGARVSFFTMQILSLLLGLWAKSKIEAKPDNRKMFVPTPKSPLDTSTENSPLTETTYFAHELAKAKEFIQQTLIGAVISSFVHIQFGVNQVVVIQSVMVPLNLYDNALLKKHIFGLGGPRYWDEKLEGESLDDAAPHPDAIDAAADSVPAPSSKKPSKAKKSVDVADAIKQAWDLGVEANFDRLLSVLKNDPNGFKTKTSDGWTPLMVACGSPIDTEKVIKTLIKEGVPIRDADNDGWTALHWCAFHGCPESAETLLASISKDDAAFLVSAKDSQGRTPLEVASEESNGDVAEILTSVSDSTPLRQRKQPLAKSDATPIDDVD
ncbi:hypothetical protein DYB37_002910 [Aphanomyces astaci]|uniref:Uncharacterized protein n=1 Tax=Aphanomyces astaci TaxID=112090 RepID=A0A397AR00_APHAT|nr:hypothetical protein DYB25_001814 [Aphanomyces astaci]RHY67333.1 hypothetical protein DYB38_001386 [Aphanomyces astaci]RHY84291.1 hypothetical protein DYB35_003086 [Aphanomyces astaci]RHZ06954.1 hypothetical protein DYB31_014862 [Aphanomyces astaci]RHZ22421.1 hypothetical protein DYB26_005552 [Aphanomyces astaci]